MASKNSRLRKRLYRPLNTRPKANKPVPLGRSVTEEDWLSVTDAVASIQRPTPLDPNWSEELGPEWVTATIHALKVLLQVQIDQDQVPDEVWETIDPSSRAGFLRNTLVNALNNYRQIVAQQHPKAPPLHDTVIDEPVAPASGIRPPG